MKKFYETPAVEFTGFNAEDVITTSAIDTLVMDAEATAKFNARVDAAKAAGTINNAIEYSAYQW